MVLTSEGKPIVEGERCGCPDIGPPLSAEHWPSREHALKQGVLLPAGTRLVPRDVSGREATNGGHAFELGVNDFIGKPKEYVGHNPLAHFAMFFMFVLPIYGDWHFEPGSTGRQHVLEAFYRRELTPTVAMEATTTQLVVRMVEAVRTVFLADPLKMLRSGWTLLTEHGFGASTVTVSVCACAKGMPSAR